MPPRLPAGLWRRLAVVLRVRRVPAVLGVRHLSHFDLSAVRKITNAGAALPEAHVHRLCAAFPAARLFLMYGMTECIRASYLPPDIAVPCQYAACADVCLMIASGVAVAGQNHNP